MLVVGAVVLGGSLLLPASRTGGADAGSGVVVTIHDFQYAPAAITVAPGTTVKWTNTDEEPHTVTSTTGAFASPGLDRTESFERRFTDAGTFAYFCALHPTMRGTVIVR